MKKNLEAQRKEMEERWKDFDNDKANFEASLNKDEELLRRMSVDVNLKE